MSALTYCGFEMFCFILILVTEHMIALLTNHLFFYFSLAFIFKLLRTSGSMSLHSAQVKYLSTVNMYFYSSIVLRYSIHLRCCACNNA